jgi:hypothetical protein
MILESYKRTWRLNMTEFELPKLLVMIDRYEKLCITDQANSDGIDEFAMELKGNILDQQYKQGEGHVRQ